MPNLVPDLPLGAGGRRLPRLVVGAVDQVVEPLALLANDLQQVVLTFGCKGVDTRGSDFHAHPASSSGLSMPSSSVAGRVAAFLGCARIGQNTRLTRFSDRAVGGHRDRRGCRRPPPAPPAG